MRRARRDSSKASGASSPPSPARAEASVSPSAPHAPLTRAVIVGVSGRMGQALLRAAPAFPGLIITGAIAWASSLALGRDAGEVAGLGRLNLEVTSDLPAALAAADV